MEIVSKDRFDELLKEDKLLVVDFFANWCMPCKMLSPVLDAVAEKYGDKITVVKVDGSVRCVTPEWLNAPLPRVTTPSGIVTTPIV